MACRCTDIWKCDTDRGRVNLALLKVGAMKLPAEIVAFNLRCMKNAVSETFEAKNMESITTEIAEMDANLGTEIEAFQASLKKVREVLSQNRSVLAQEDAEYHKEEERKKEEFERQQQGGGILTDVQN